ncbi:MAG: cbb3-type cytochrome c oxidase subunit 3 [Hyphomicrobium sp.]|nr:cbb3-type cytochrome c oxidase subunit 3 [Hyphomicrobium sp.]
MSISYETIATVSQTGSLLIFVALFVAVLAYALWPANRERFHRASTEALDLGQDPFDTGSKRGDIR